MSDQPISAALDGIQDFLEGLLGVFLGILEWVYMFFFGIIDTIVPVMFDNPAFAFCFIAAICALFASIWWPRVSGLIFIITATEAYFQFGGEPLSWHLKTQPGLWNHELVMLAYLKVAFWSWFGYFFGRRAYRWLFVK